jgi:DNA-binding protein HU-beta
MNKGDLIDAIAKGTGISKAQSQEALDTVTKSITAALKKGDKVTLVGFGTFSVSKRSARIGRNPQTGKEIKIAAKKVAKFKAGKELSAKIK